MSVSSANEKRRAKLAAEEQLISRIEANIGNVDIIVIVEGGLVQGAWAPKGHNLYVVDYDNINAGDDHPFESNNKMKRYIKAKNLKVVW